MTEEWKEISGYEGLYEVSNFGRIRSIEHDDVRKDGAAYHRSQREIHQRKDSDGYLIVRLSKNCVVKQHKVHSVVAKAFVSGWFDGAEVNHKDFDRSNNHASNLEWMTHSDNVAYTVNAGRHVCSTDISGTNNPNYGNRTLHDKYSKDPVLAKEKQGRSGARNGRARSVSLVDESGNAHCFDTIMDCASYIVAHACLDCAVSSIAIGITKCIKENKKYHGYNLSFI